MTETLLPMSSKAPTEILVHNTRGYIEQPQLVSGPCKILGAGALLGEEPFERNMLFVPRRKREGPWPAARHRPIITIYASI